MMLKKAERWVYEAVGLKLKVQWRPQGVTDARTVQCLQCGNPQAASGGNPRQRLHRL